MSALEPFDALRPAPAAGQAPSRDTVPCHFCGFLDGMAARSFAYQGQGGTPAGHTACLICADVLDLSRPAIDHEALIVWMPEMSQAALNRMVRGLQIALIHGGHSPALHDQPTSGADPTPGLYRSLGARRQAAAARIGTSSPTLFVRTVSRVAADTHASRSGGTTGLRVLHLGRHFIDGRDIYPSVVRGWASVAAT